MSPPRKSPPISEADQALWNSVAGTVRKLPKKDTAAKTPPKPPAPRKTKPPVTATAEHVKPSADLRWTDETSPQRGDKKRIKQGILKPTKRLDLHGYTVARAEKALLPFLQQARRDGHAWVEIITGHGRFKTDEDGIEKGVLKRLLPEWLNKPLLRSQIKRVLPAPQSRGGAVWVQLVDG